MKKVVIIVALLIVIAGVYFQGEQPSPIPWYPSKGSLKVVCYDELGLPLPNVTVQVLSTELIKRTDKNGTATFSVDVGEYTVLAEYNSELLTKLAKIEENKQTTVKFVFNVTINATTTTFAVLADTRSYTTELEEILEFLSVFDPQPEFVVFAGDMDPVQQNMQVTDNFFDNYDARGNHETSSDVNYLKTRIQNDEYITDIYGEGLSYVFVRGNTQWIILDDYIDTSDGGIFEGSDYYMWIESKLQELDTGKPIFVVTHEPFFPQGRHVGDSLDQYPEHRDALWNLLKQYNVSIVFAGHTHVYYIHRDGLLEVNAGAARVSGVADGATAIYCNAYSNQTVTCDVYKSSDLQSWVKVESIAVEG